MKNYKYAIRGKNCYGGYLYATVVAESCCSLERK